ncbi:MAG: transposase [Solirubrobacterales bacterium]|nr:transposase [Solirubrobacterales bacterium]
MATRPEQGPDCGTAAPAPPAADGAADPRGRPRLRSPDRQQLLPPIRLDQRIEPDHPARSVWRFVEQLDLSVLYDPIRSREHTPGNPATDPRILVALWLYAIFYGVISARRVEELSRHHNAFRWLRGGVPLNHHMLSDLLVGHPQFLNQLFRHSVNELEQQGLVELERVGQDGMRVRASAGAASFRRLATLEALLQQAQRELQDRPEELAGQAEPDASEVAPQQGVTAEQAEPAGGDPEPPARQRGARRRAAQERLERAQQALDRLPELQARKQPGDNEARASTTDPDATVMKMPDGGFRPAYNFQYSTDTASLVIVGVDVVTVGSDQGQLPPMLDQIEASFGKRPHEALVDGGFVKHADIEAVQAGGEGKPGGSRGVWCMPRCPSRSRRAGIGMRHIPGTASRW